MQFTLKDVDMELYLGVPDEERATKQTVKVSVSFDYDTRNAETSDDITDTIDYFSLYKLIKSFPGDREYQLIEKLYKELENAIQKAFPYITNLGLIIEKFPFEEASISIKR